MDLYIINIKKVCQDIQVCCFHSVFKTVCHLFDRLIFTSLFEGNRNLVKSFHLITNHLICIGFSLIQIIRDFQITIWIFSVYVSLSLIKQHTCFQIAFYLEAVRSIFIRSKCKFQRCRWSFVFRHLNCLTESIFQRISSLKVLRSRHSAAAAGLLQSNLGLTISSNTDQIRCFCSNMNTISIYGFQAFRLIPLIELCRYTVRHFQFVRLICICNHFVKCLFCFRYRHRDILFNFLQFGYVNFLRFCCDFRTICVHLQNIFQNLLIPLIGI